MSTRVFTGTPWESKVGYCRAIKKGNLIFVSGTTSVNADGSIHGAGDGYQQARRCFEIIEKSLNELGAGLSDVVLTRMFVTDISRWEQFAKAQEFFGEHPPVTSMYEVKALINPQMLIEVEAQAVVELQS